jgi:hypothetical protein
MSVKNYQLDRATVRLASASRPSYVIIEVFNSSKESGDFDMHKIQFKGRVLPAALPVTILGGPSLHIENEHLGLVSEMRFNIQDNLITVDCDVNKLEPATMGSLVIRAHNTVESAVNLLSFSTGVGHSVILDKCHLPGGAVQDVIMEDRELAKFATAIQSSSDLQQFLKMCLVEPPLFLAIRDLSDAIKTSNLAEINCTRAIETIRNYFIPPGGSRKDGWMPMRKALNVSQEYVTSITNLSRGPRHGDYYEMPTQKVRDACEKTWMLMNRFLEYRKRGNQPLPLSEFCLLD